MLGRLGVSRESRRRSSWASSRPLGRDHRRSSSSSSRRGRSGRRRSSGGPSSSTTSPSSSRRLILLSLAADDPGLGALRRRRPVSGRGVLRAPALRRASACSSWSSGNNLITIYVSLELMALSSYILAGLLQGRDQVDRGGAQVLHPRRVLLGRSAVRALARLRRGGEDGPARAREALRLGRAFEPADARDPAHPGGPALQDRGGAVPRLDAGRLRRLADAGDRLLLGRSEGRGLRASWRASSTWRSRSSTPTGGSSSRSSPRPR